jgi:hypothetical protein
MFAPDCVWCVDKEGGGGRGRGGVGGVGRTGLKQCVAYGKGQWEIGGRGAVGDKRHWPCGFPSGFRTERESARARERELLLECVLSTILH